MNDDISIKWIKAAAIYLLVGVLLGIHMGKSHDFVLAPVHAHVNLLGWATMALMGILHHLFSKQLQNKLATAQFWLHQIGTPILLVSLSMMLSGNASIEPVVGISSMVVGASVAIFLVNILRNLRPNR